MKAPVDWLWLAFVVWFGLGAAVDNLFLLLAGFGACVGVLIELRFTRRQEQKILARWEAHKNDPPEVLR